MKLSDFTKPIIFMYNKLFKPRPAPAPIDINSISPAELGTLILQRLGIDPDASESLSSSSRSSTLSSNNSIL